MLIAEIINNVVAGGLLGSLGQGIRIAVGLKKLNETNVLNEAKNFPTEEFNTGRMIISIFTGFVAGALGMIIKFSSSKDIGTETILTIIAFGYSGADFIEGVFNTYSNKFTPTTAPANQPAAPPDAPALVPPTSNSTGVPPSNSQVATDLPESVPDEANFSNTPAQG